MAKGPKNRTYHADAVTIERTHKGWCVRVGGKLKSPMSLTEAEAQALAAQLKEAQ